MAKAYETKGKLSLRSASGSLQAKRTILLLKECTAAES